MVSRAPTASVSHQNSRCTDDAYSTCSEASAQGRCSGVRAKVFFVVPALIADGAGASSTTRMARAPQDPRQRTTEPPGP
eukprot:2758354-Pyramimonas_sp.AAC.1